MAVVGPRKGSRFHRMDDIPKDTFTQRMYLIELLERALKRNTILCLSCPRSKVFLSLMITKQMSSITRLSLENGGKRTFYLVDLDEDIETVYQMLPHHTDLVVGKVCTTHCTTQEEDGYRVNGTTGDKAMITSWEEIIETCSIIVCKGSCFLSALTNGIIQLKIINLLIFDDCHKCVETEDHPYVNIVSRYVKESESKESLPHIVGVTSSIAGTECTDPKQLQHTIQSMEKLLHCYAETSVLILSERFGCRPKESVISCCSLNESEKQSLLSDVLEDILLDSLEFLQDCNIAIDDSVDNRNPLETPITVVTECLNILAILGSWCTSSVAEVFIMQIDKIIKCEKNDVHKKFLRSVNTALRRLTKIFDNEFVPEFDVDQLLEYTTSKVKELVNVLRNYKPEIDFMIINNDESFDNDGSFSDMSDEEDEFMMSGSDGEEDENGASGKSCNRPQHIAIKRTPEGIVERLTNFSEEEDKNLCGIVFVENHYIAFGLNRILEEICSWDENLCFVKNCHIIGHSLKGGAAKTKRPKSYKKQEETLRKFRMHEKNLVIATQELEEGIDLPKCNLVVRFDPPKDYRSYTLSKGRARARDASFIILLDEDNGTFFHSNLQVFKGIEQVLLGNHKTENQVHPDANYGGNDEDCVLPSYSSDCTEITMDGAIALINRYCAKLPSDAFTHLTPQCRIETIPGDPPGFVACLRLPINSPIKEELKGPKMMSVKLAEKAVALKMCEILHKKGELDNNLVPVGKEMFLYEEEDEWADEEDGAGQARPGSTKRKQYYVKKVADALVQSQVSVGQPCFLYLLNLRLTGKITDEQNTRGRVIYAPEDTSQTLGLLLSKRIPQMPSFPIYTRSGEVTASVDIIKENITFTGEEFISLQDFHHFVFSGVLNLEKEPMEFSTEKAESGCMVIPLNGTNNLDIDWQFVHKVVEFMKTEKRRTVGNVTKKELFNFSIEKFEDAVVMPSYRNIDQPQHFYVAEIRNDLNPCSPFPSPDLYKTFQDYYTTKYGLAITNTTQPLLDVDHTSIRLNLLTPRYMNQKGVALPTSSAETKKARRENLQQKQILIPELCDVHVFPASLWRKTVCLPAILYRLNCLLLSEELRRKISKETAIGIDNLPEDFRFPKLDFGFDTSPENLKEAESKKDENTCTNELSPGENGEIKEETCRSHQNVKEINEAVVEIHKTQNGDYIDKRNRSEVNSISPSNCNLDERFCSDEKIIENDIEDRNVHSPKLTSQQPQSNGFSHGHDTAPVVSNQNGESMSEGNIIFVQQKKDNSPSNIDDSSHVNSITSAHDSLMTETTRSKYENVDNSNMDNDNTNHAHDICMQCSITCSNDKPQNEPNGAKFIKQVQFTSNSTTEPSSPMLSSLSSCRQTCKCHISSSHSMAANVDQTQSGQSKLIEHQMNIASDKLLELKLSAETTSNSLKMDNDAKTYVIDNTISSMLKNESSNKDVIYSSNGCDYENHAKPSSALNKPLYPSNKLNNIADYNDKEVKRLNDRNSLGEVKSVFRSLDHSPGECMRELLNEKNNICNVSKTSSEKEAKYETDYASKTTSPSGDNIPSTTHPSSLSSPAIVMNSLGADLNDLHVDLILPPTTQSETFQFDNCEWAKTPQTNANGQTNGTSFSHMNIPDSFEENLKDSNNTAVKDEDIIKFSFSADKNKSAESKKNLVIDEWNSKKKGDNYEQDEKLNEVKYSSSSEEKVSNVKNPSTFKDHGTKQAKSTSSFTIDVWQPSRKRNDLSDKTFVESEVDSSQIFHSSSVIGLDEDRNLKTFAGPSPCLILQALTMSNANDFFSLERLETIGDSFLKYAITVYLYCSYPGIHEGKLSFLRSKQVSNYNLYRLGRRKGLAEYMVSTKFEPYENWLPPGFIINSERRRGPVPKVIIVPPLKNNTNSSNLSIEESIEAVKKDEAIQFTKELELLQHSQEVDQKDMEQPGTTTVPFCLPCHHGLPDKSIADCVESLIGCYLTTCGRKAALMFMSWLGLKVLPKKAFIGQDNSKEAKMSKSDWVQLSEQDFDDLQRPPSPMFSSHPEDQAKLNLLLEGFDSLEEKLCYKFNDRSYLLQAFTHASYHYNTITDCYQRIEFLGDAILDYVITRHLYEDSQKYSPGILTDLRSALVNNNIFAALAVKWGFHRYFKAISPSLFSVIDKFVTRQKEKNYDDIDVDEEYRELNLDEGDADETNEEEDDEEEVEMEIPKALGDIFESVAGAIYLDSGMSLDTVWRVYYRMMKVYIDKYLKSIPKSPVRELLEREPETAKFERPQRTMNGKVRVTVNVVGKGVFSGVGRNYRIAKSAAAKKALRFLRSTSST